MHHIGDAGWSVNRRTTLAAMRWLAAVLLLVTSSGAVQYRRQVSVPPPGPAVSTQQAVSGFVCALHCEAQSLDSCGGFSYSVSDSACRLFSGGSRCLAGDSSTETSDPYYSRGSCLGKQMWAIILRVDPIQVLPSSSIRALSPSRRIQA